LANNTTPRLNANGGSTDKAKLSSENKSRRRALEPGYENTKDRVAGALTSVSPPPVSSPVSGDNVPESTFDERKPELNPAAQPEAPAQIASASGIDKEESFFARYKEESAKAPSPSVKQKPASSREDVAADRPRKISAEQGTEKNRSESMLEGAVPAKFPQLSTAGQARAQLKKDQVPAAPAAASSAAAVGQSRELMSASVATATQAQKPAAAKLGYSNFALRQSNITSASDSLSLTASKEIVTRSRAATVPAGNPQSEFYTAEQLRLRGKVREAIAGYESVIASAPGTELAAVSQRKIGDLYFEQLKQMDLAAKAYKSCLAPPLSGYFDAETLHAMRTRVESAETSGVSSTM
jgi:hypothetical protein